MTHRFHIGDRVQINDRRFGELTGTILFLSEDFITAKLDKPRKKLYPTDRAYELTSHRRNWKLIPHFDIKTDEGIFKVHNHKSARKPTKEELAKWREECLASSQS